MAGVVSGVGKVLAGYPFDFVKGRVQAGIFPSPMAAVRATLIHEGPWAFYQGATTPAVAVCAVGGVVFYVNGTVKRILVERRERSRSYLIHSSMIREKLTEDLIAGCCGGFAVGIIVNPMEVVKLRMQIIRLQHNPGAPTASKNVGRHLMLRTARSLTPQQWAAGWHLTLFREISTFGLFFPANEFFRSVLLLRSVATPHLIVPNSSPETPLPSRGDAESARSRLSIPARVLAAGAAGVVGWLPCYPVDVVKSRVQAGIVGGGESGGGVPSARSVAMHLYRTEGWRGFTRGIAPCLLRAFPAYAAQYILYEFMVSSVLPSPAK